MSSAEPLIAPAIGYRQRASLATSNARAEPAAPRPEGRASGEARRESRAQLRTVRLTRRSFSLMAALLDLAVILWTAVTVETIYNKAVYGWNGFAQSSLTL